MGYRVPAADPAEELKILKDVLTRLPDAVQRLEGRGDVHSFLQELAKLGRSVGSGTLEVPYALEDYKAREAPRKFDELGNRRK